MPPYRSTYPRYRRRYYRWNRWSKRRRARKPFRRRWYIRRRTRKPKYKVKKFKFSKKKSKIIVKQFQPKRIRKCKITGYKCLFQGNINRSNNNFIQYIYSYYNEDDPGGGGWSLLVFSLDSLYEDYNHLENIWTESNAGLPLVRYLGCSFKLYQSEETDYVFMYDNCWPMTDTIYKHADSAPFRMLQQTKKIIVPSRRTKLRKKPYKRVFIKPPAQMTNKWYFQHDLCKTPLVMTTTTAVSLSLPFCRPECKNNNITIFFLNPYLFKNANFQHFDTTGYFPKYKENSQTPLYLYASTYDNINILSKDNEKVKQEAKTFIPLTDTKNYKKGNTLGTVTQNNIWNASGNPFHTDYTSPETSMYFYLSELTPKEMFEVCKNGTSTKSATLTGTIIHSTRYNPQTDTGQDNKAYLVNNELGGFIVEPKDKNYIIDGFPLFYLLWGWVDWIRKLGTAINLDTNYFVTIETKFLLEKRYPFIVPLDPQFVYGKNPYVSINDHDDQLTEYNKQNWYPRHQYQKLTINNICQSGPATPKPPYNHYLQALCKYSFYFKWGGCPKSLQKAYSPCSQPRWPTADNIIPRLEIENPNTDPKTQLYSWDWNKDYVAQCAIQRIKQYTEINGKIFSLTDSKNNPPATQTYQKKAQEKEQEKEIQQQLQLLKYHRVLLELKLRTKLKS